MEQGRVKDLVEVLVGMRLEGIEWENAPYEHCGREGLMQLKLPVVGTGLLGEFILTILLRHLRKTPFNRLTNLVYCHRCHNVHRHFVVTIASSHQACCLASEDTEDLKRLYQDQGIH